MLAEIQEAVLRTTFFCAFTTCLLALPLAAQISQATLSGTVRDSTGAVIPNAAVEIRNLATNFTRTAKTGPQGEYVIADLPAEHYMVRISFTGFKTGVLPDLELQVGQHATYDAVLETGSIDQQMTVEAIARDGLVEVGRVNGPANSEFFLPVKKPKLWSPDSPFLYDLELTVKKGGKEVDHVSSYFGMLYGKF